MAGQPGSCGIRLSFRKKELPKPANLLAIENMVRLLNYFFHLHAARAFN